jgi:hypothetical protein
MLMILLMMLMMTMTILTDRKMALEAEQPLLM